LHMRDERERRGAGRGAGLFGAVRERLRDLGERVEERARAAPGSATTSGKEGSSS